MAHLDPRLNARIAHLRSVRQAVRAEADQRAARVAAVLAAHTQTGDLARSLEVEDSATDSVISISDPDILAINYGHEQGGRWVEGIHAIEAGL